jgi:hypothetical protein
VILSFSVFFGIEFLRPSELKEYLSQVDFEPRDGLSVDQFVAVISNLIDRFVTLTRYWIRLCVRLWASEKMQLTKVIFWRLGFH